MTIQLDPHHTGDSVLFRVKVYDVDGVTLATPASCTCTVWNEAGTAQVTDQAGTTGSGYAQYNWAGTATAGNYRAVLTVTLSAGVIQSEEFYVAVEAEPPAFTTDLDDDIGQLRLELGDDVSGSGVKPDGSNFTDAQLQAFLDREGSVMRALAAACENLARRWSLVANITVGPRSEQLGQIAGQWSKRGEELRDQYGGAAISGAFAVMPARVDGYSDAADSATEYSLED